MKVQNPENYNDKLIISNEMKILYRFGPTEGKY